MTKKNDQNTVNAQSLWGGHFESGPAPLMEKINASIAFDQRLYRQDIQGSLAHAKMLCAQKILSEQDYSNIVRGLNQILEEIEQGRFVFKAELEDIHLNVEARLTELIGDAGKRLHTGRSRNDQVATDFKMWVRDMIDRISLLLTNLLITLVEKAQAHAATIMPGFTHLQAAQPVTFGHHLMAYAEMFSRDRERFADTRKRLNECPLGAAALAGTGFPIDRKMTASELGFDRPACNSLDAVSDRDFALEFLSSASICAIHLSRMAEELVLWSTPQFAFVTMPEDFTSGSSIMPQKRNPDAAELVRAKSGRIIGNLTGLLIALKGLPLAYSKDMQEDKEGVFDAADNLDLCLDATAQMISGMAIHQEAMEKAAGFGYPTATDLADWLVREKSLPFREAHHVAASAVKLAEQSGCDLSDLPLDGLQKIDGRITEDVIGVLDLKSSVKSRQSFGGTAPENVLNAIDEFKNRL